MDVLSAAPSRAHSSAFAHTLRSSPSSWYPRRLPLEQPIEKDLESLFLAASTVAVAAEVAAIGLGTDGPTRNAEIIAGAIIVLVRLASAVAKAHQHIDGVRLRGARWCDPHRMRRIHCHRYQGKLMQHANWPTSCQMLRCQACQARACSSARPARGKQMCHYQCSIRAPVPFCQAEGLILSNMSSGQQWQNTLWLSHPSCRMASHTHWQLRADLESW